MIVKLTTMQSYELLAKFGCYVTEACDKCGQLLGAVRYTRKVESGEWCSRQCRDGNEAHAPKTCKYCHACLPKGKRRGTLYCDKSCKQAAHRSKSVVEQKLSVTKPSINGAFCSVSKPGSYPHSRKGQSVLEAPANATLAESLLGCAESSNIDTDFEQKPGEGDAA